MVFFRKISVAMALFISVASWASERDTGINIDEVMKNDAAFQQAYVEHDVKYLGLTEAEFKQKFKQFYDFGQDAEFRGIADQANESLGKVIGQQNVSAELRTQAIRDLNMLKVAQANYVGLNVSKIDAFVSASLKVLSLSKKK